MKTIAVMGTGNVAQTLALDMKMKGHKVHLFTPAEYQYRIQKIMDTYEIEAVGAIVGKVKLDKVTTDIDEAVKGADYIVVAVPGNRHEEYAHILKGHTTADQLVIVFNAGLASLLFKNVFGDDKNCPTFADTEVPPFSTRIVEPGKVRVFERHVTGIAFFPATAGERYYEELCEEFYPYTKQYKDVMECALSLINPAVHPGPCLVNMTNIENPNFNFHLYEHGWSPSGLKIDVQLNEERRRVAAALGYPGIKAVEDFAGVDHDMTWEDYYTLGHGCYALTSIAGPNDIEYRYLTEDIPIALVCWSSLGKLVGVETPVMDSVIRLVGVVHGKDWFEQGRNAKRIGLVNKTPQQIMEYVRTGK